MWAPTNPFAWDLATVEVVNDSIGNEQQSAAAGTPDVDNNGGNGGFPFEHCLPHTRLPDFWLHAPAMWFARVECRFEMMGRAAEILLCGGLAALRVAEAGSRPGRLAAGREAVQHLEGPPAAGARLNGGEAVCYAAARR
jgi:hypothetical protein